MKVFLIDLMGSNCIYLVKAYFNDLYDLPPKVHIEQGREGSDCWDGFEGDFRNIVKLIEQFILVMLYDFIYLVG
jgi:hypothetical protein